MMLCNGSCSWNVSELSELTSEDDGVAIFRRRTTTRIDSSELSHCQQVQLSRGSIAPPTRPHDFINRQLSTTIKPNKDIHTSWHSRVAQVTEIEESQSSRAHGDEGAKDLTAIRQGHAQLLNPPSRTVGGPVAQGLCPRPRGQDDGRKVESGSQRCPASGC
ncbi:hypothetical protein K491DRAFT_759654 [Lophiostoma macrostomum CBS 122681]|uniref:Uncharacterized protein n=1 Tax=Lophiostoma macrostomum CBS 122681 TaxID=1314788 RepID=A0A6A6T266_9PLEO|nr:hypothetical protein K491DRAFT_759654 [Lophiostoma macrostomum CBS 122681]